MSLSDFLIHATRVTFLALGLVSLWELARRRERARLDVALFFGSLAYVVAVQEVITFANVRPELLVKSIQLAVLAHAYLLLRVLQNLRPVPRWLMRAALAGLVLSAGVWLAFVAPPPPFSLPTIAYLVAVDAYAVWALVRGALTSRGVTRRRLELAALGAGLLGGALLVALGEALAPRLAPESAYAIQGLAILSALAFYLGFAAPRWVRHWWQLAELERFLNASQDAPADEPVAAALERLCQAAVRAAGGQSAFVVSRGAPGAGWQVSAATEPPLAQWWANNWPDGWSLPAGPAGRTRLPAATHTPQLLPPGEMPPARTVLLAPIGSAHPGQDLLVVILAYRPLFPRDDQSLLNLMGSHSALMLEQKAMIGQLRGQNQELVQANQELEAFADSVSHDLRTPLRHIEGFAELLRDANPAEPAQVYLDRIFTATGHMAHLIDVFLAFSRLGRSELALSRVSLAALVAQVKDELEPEARGRQVEWRIAPLPEALGDPVLLRQAWTNLMGNALKYTRPRAPARIEIGVLAAAEAVRTGAGGRQAAAGGGAERAAGDSSSGAGAGQVVVFVRDNGVGFDPAYAGQLFTMFRRLHHASQFEGDGIGLAVVRRIVQRHSGRVWAEGRPDGGATFYMALPLPREQPAAVEQPAVVLAVEPPAAAGNLNPARAGKAGP